MLGLNGGVDGVRRGLVAGLGVAWLASHAAPVGAQPQRITFADAVQLSLQQSTLVQRAQSQVAFDRTSVNEAKMQFLPDLRFQMSGSTTWGRSFDDASGRLLTETSVGLNTNLSSSMTLFNGFTNIASLRQARLSAEATDFDLERAQQTIVFQVITGFLALVEATEQVRVVQENLAAQVEQERNVGLQVDGGRRPISDLYEQRASVARAQLAVVEQRGTLQLRELELWQILQLDPEQEYAFDVPTIPTTPEEDARGLAALLARAFERRPDWLALQRRVAAAQQDERAARGGRWPSLSLSAGYGSNYSDRSSTSGLIDQLNERQSGSVGVGLSYPIFDRLAVSRSIERAGIGIDQAQYELADLRYQVGFEVRRAVVDRNTALETLRAAEAQLAAAQQALDATQQRYDAGAATLQELTIARADFVAATSERVNATYVLRWQKHVVDYYTGDLDPASPVVP